MKISIAMTTYNGERFLQEQLDSFLWQTRLPDELVVCDDGSTDRTLEVLEAFAHKAPFPVRVFRNPQRLGFSKNFEKAALMCSGDLIAFSDQDDVWLPKKLFLISDSFKDKNIGFVFHDFIIYGNKRSKFKYNVACNKNKLIRFIMQDNAILGCSLAIRNIFHKITIFPIPEYWSYDKWLPFVLINFYNFYHINYPLILYRQHDKQLFGIRKKFLYEKIINAIKIKKDHYKTKIIKWENAINCLENNSNHYIIFNINKKINLLKNRAYKDKLSFKWWLDIIKALYLGEYHYYENGFKSFIKDIVL